MPKPRERDPSDKIKSKGKSNGRPVRDVRRQMTAKLRKELVEQKRAGQEPTADVQAVDQVEQTGAASFDKVSQETGQLLDRAIHPAHRPKERTEAVKGDGRRPRERRSAGNSDQAAHKTVRGQDGAVPGQNGAAHLSGAKTEAVETGPASHYIHGETDTPPPTPQERMKRQAAKELERAGHTGELPQGRGAPRAFHHYGGRPPEAVSPKNHFSPANQSIHPSNPSSNRPSIKERPRRSAAPREKPPGGSFIPKTRQRIEQTAGKHRLQAAGKPAAKQVTERARRRAQAAAQKSLTQRAKQAAKTAAGLSKKAVVGVTKAVAAMVSALVSLVGGAVLVLALAVVLLIGALLASPFGIFFSGEPTKDAVPLSAAVAQVNVELADKLTDLQDGNGYDRVEIQGQPPDWSEVAAVFAAKTAGAEDGIDVAALPPDKVELLKNVFWDMCTISSTVETIEHPASGDEDAWTEKVLIITITPKTAEEMRTAYAFTEFQNQSLTDLLAEGDSLAALLGDLAITQADAVELLRDLPAGLDPERRAVVETACKLVGKVNYFWGGKSLTMGWNDTWGTLRQVTAAGSSTTGTYRPYGMDCSGFVDWVFYNITGGEYVIGHGGGAHAQHTYCDPISWDEAVPGDLVFYPEDSHVGIVGGWDESGNLLIIHCAFSANNVVITGADGFTSIARPRYFGT